MRFTTRLLSLLALVIAMTAGAFAQIPRTISFQGVLADAQGVLLPDNTYTLTLSIYDQATGGTAIFSESQPVQVFRGVFNAIIGATSPGGIPAAIDFNSPYWLGVQVNNGAELAPRTEFTSVPYALNAAVAQVAVRANFADTASYAMAALTADTAVTIRGGYVSSVNGQQGTLEILGAGATTITRTGNQFIIRSTDTSGGGIRRIDNFDGSLVVDPPQGPFVTIFIRAEGVQTYHLANTSITTEKIADQAVTNPKLAPDAVTTDKIMDGTILTQDIADTQVTAAKINTEGATAGYALMSDGTNTPLWADPILMNIPYSATVASDDTLWSMTNIGTGGAGGFNIVNDTNMAAALTAATDGQGYAIHAEHSATTGTTAAIHGISNSLDFAAEAVTGVITTTTPGAFSSAIRGINNGTGGLGIGVWGSQGGSGWGVHGFAPSGIGVIGTTTTGMGVYGAADSGIGVYGTSVTGDAGQFWISNIAGTGNAVAAYNAGDGEAVLGVNSGTGGAGWFEITDAANTSTGVQSFTAGTGWAIHGRRGISNIFTGNGGILGESSTGPGVVGFSSSGNGVIAASQTSTGLLAISFGSSPAIDAQGIGTNSIGIRAMSLTGTVGRFDALTGNTADALVVNNAGSGRGLVVDNTSVTNALPAIRATSAGTGTTLHALNTGTGSAATFEINNAASTAVDTRVINNGLGGGLTVQMTNAGSGARGIDVTHAGFGTGVFATSVGGMALWGIASSMSAAGVLGDNTYGEAVVGRNRGGVGVGAVVGRNDSTGYGVRGFNTMSGIGVLGQGGISGGTAVGGRFENVNAASPANALEGTTNGTGYAGAFWSTNATTAAKGVFTSTPANVGGMALHIANGTVALSYDASWTTGDVLDDAVIVLTTGGNHTLPTTVPDGTTVWVVNNSGVAAGIANSTVGPYALAIGRAQQFVFLTGVSGTNWVPMQ